MIQEWLLNEIVNLKKFTKFKHLKIGGKLQIKPYKEIYIQGEIEFAIDFFRKKFNVEPVNHPFSNANYAISEHNTLRDAVGMDEEYISRYIKRKDILVIYVK